MRKGTFQIDWIVILFLLIILVLAFIAEAIYGDTENANDPKAKVLKKKSTGIYAIEYNGKIYKDCEAFTKTK